MSTWASELLTIYNALDEDRQQLILDYSQQLVEEQLLEEQRAANRV